MTAPKPDPWETLRRLTVDQLVTQVKLSGSAMQFNGFTTPEGWPFTLVLAVAKPGNERAVELAQEFSRKMTAAAKWTKREDR